jgi:hypothetical protein
MSDKGQTTAAKNVVADVVHGVKNQGTQPPVVGDRFAYGVITEVNDQQQVKVELYSRKDEQGNFQQILAGKYIPLATQQSTIHFLYGELRPGLQVLVHWRGKLRPTWAIAHIIGDEDLNILEEEALPADMSSPPLAFLSGGMTDL